MAKISAKKIKIDAKSKPLASRHSFIHILIKEDMEQIDLKDKGRGIPISAPHTLLKIGLLHCKYPFSPITLSSSVSILYDMFAKLSNSNQNSCIALFLNSTLK